MIRRRTLASFAFIAAAAAASLPSCGDDLEPLLPSTSATTASSATASTGSAGGNGGAGSSPYEAVPLDTTISTSSLDDFVDVVRDEQGIPHIYGASEADVIFVEGYMAAHDRWTQMDLIRRAGAGRLAELFGGLSAALIDQDIQIRVHHLESTAQAQIDALTGSTDATDQRTVKLLQRYADGVNAWIADLKAGKYELPSEISFLYSPASIADWKPSDSLVILGYEEFLQGYDEGDLTLTTIEARAQQTYGVASTDPAVVARKDIAKDLLDLRPVDATFTIDGWTGSDGTMAMNDAPIDQGLLAVIDADRASRPLIPGERFGHYDHGSNNWVVSAKLSATGNALLANDPHLQLSNPPIWWLTEVNVGGATPGKIMGAGIPGLPGPLLGMNEHTAWGVTDSFVDNSDFYAETVVTCDNSSDPCVMFNGAKVALTTRVESIDVGSMGKISETKKITFYEVPHHGPILPRVTASHDIEPLASNEISARWVGHEPQKEAVLTLGLFYAKSVSDSVKAIDASWKNCGFNWVIADDQGHIGWTERARVPRRAPGFAPWKVLPGDGTAEWGADLDPKYVPHSFNPAKGFLATANNDPIGVTKDGDPFFGQPMVDGAPLYVGWDYDRGTRVDRITTRLGDLSANGGKIALLDMSSVQADAISNEGKYASAVFVTAAKALLDEQSTPGTHPELAAMLASAGADAKAALPFAHDKLAAWTFDTPAGVDEDSPTPAQIVDSQASVVFFTSYIRAVHGALDDECAALGVNIYAFPQSVWRHLFGDQLLLGTGKDMTTGDAVLWDDVTTTMHVESRLEITAKALLDALGAMSTRLGADTSKWRWGTLHTITFASLLPIATLDIPPPSDPEYPKGFPRHGGDGTVDVAGANGPSSDDYSYGEGPSMRFVAEMTKDGPKARNALPGGEIFDTSSPHYRDLAELWRKNQTFDMKFTDADVVASALKEQTTNKIGRWRFTK